MKDKERLRELAQQWMELAQQPIMEERKALWGKLHALQDCRPMMLVETGYIADFVRQEELQCADAYLRRVEQYLLEHIIHAREVGDDLVLEPFLRIGYSMEQPSFGVEVQMVSADKGLAYVFEHVITRPEQMQTLVQREFAVDHARTAARKQRLEELFGDILPVRVCNYDFFDEDGCFDWVGNFFFGLTWQLHRFMGLENMMLWYYDHPQEMHALLRYMTDDRLRMFRTLEREGCLAANTDGQMAGPCFYGYCDDMPQVDGAATTRQLWAWCESQESSSISVPMYEEFVLPYLAELSAHFGKIYYGCCEPVYDRIDVLRRKIPNLRALSVSMWNDFDVVGERIGKDFVYSRKPAPPQMSGTQADWELVRRDLEITKRSAQGCHLELLFRDLYDIGGERGRLRQWTDLVRQVWSI